MRSFRCDNCRAALFFENTACLSCGLAQGYVPGTSRLAAIASTEAGEIHLVTGPVPGLRRCRNAGRIGCNWLVELNAADAPEYCRACRLTRTRPADTDEAGIISWTKAEAAKRRLVFQLDDLALPLPALADGVDGGLAFDLLSSKDQAVITGHEDGIVTIDMAEGIDSHRERVRDQLAEPYRTLLGHFRHETGHYYEWLLVERPGRQDRVRSVFGDERVDYAAEIERHYSDGPPPDWDRHYVSSYATMHPYEDFAETFAHYLHARDTLQTAHTSGLWLSATDGRGGARAVPVGDEPSTIDELMASWLPLTVALNGVNRSMGLDDLYPFALAPAVIDKLGAIHALLTEPP